MGDGRKVNVLFKTENGKTGDWSFLTPKKKTQLKCKKNGWQSILNNFKKYAEDN